MEINPSIISVIFSNVIITIPNVIKNGFPINKGKGSYNSKEPPNGIEKPEVRYTKIPKRALPAPKAIENSVIINPIIENLLVFFE